MTNRERATVLLDYEVSRKFIDKIDNQLFKIKGWALLTASGVIAYGVSQRSLTILFINILVVVGFCFMETIYKTFHETGIARAQLLEEILRKDLNPRYKLPSIYRFGLGLSLYPPTLKSVLKIVTHPGRWHLITYYFLIVIGSIVTGFCINLLH